METDDLAKSEYARLINGRTFPDVYKVASVAKLFSITDVSAFWTFFDQAYKLWSENKAVDTHTLD